MPTGLMDRLPSPGLTPRELVQRVGDDIGVDMLRAWCVDLLRLRGDAAMCPCAIKGPARQLQGLHERRYGTTSQS